jgi:hypothetical protein
MPYDLYGATVFGMNYVVVGAGQVLVSADATNWVHYPLGPSPTDLWGVVAGDHQLVAVGSEWPTPTQVRGVVMTSFEGAVWVPRTGGIADQAYYGIAWRPDVFVAVGLQSQVPNLAAVSLSANGEAWQRAGVTWEGSLSGVAEGLGAFVAVGSYTNPASGQLQGRIGVSPDGRSWSDRTPSGAGALQAVAFGGNRLVAVGLTNVWTSTNALDWTRPDSRTATNLQAITFGKGLFVATGLRGTIQTSADGDVWTTHIPSTPTTRALRGVAFGNDRFVAVGNLGTVIVSDNGLDWTTVDSGTTDIFYAVAFGNGSFVAVGFAATNPGFSAIWTSPDGANWRQRVPPSVQALRGVTYGYGSFVAVGEYGTILQSAQANDWIVTRVDGWQPGGFGLTVQATPGTPLRLQASTDLRTGSWQDIATLTNSVSTTSLVDTSATAFPWKFYRVVSP